MVENLVLSGEFEGRIAPVARLYYAHFLRAPDFEGLSFWSGLARRGASVQAIFEQFVKSREFANRYGTLTDSQYIDRVYLNVLGRGAEPEGRNYWLGQLRSGLTRGGMMAEFSESAEFRTGLDPTVRATMLYVGMFRRAPDPAGLQDWANAIGADTPYRDIIARFLESREYGNRMATIYRARHPLTGIPARTSVSRTALAVKVDNVRAARPQTGLDRADIVYEEMVEGNLTRLIAVFHSDVPDVVGPVRSVRTTDINSLTQLDTPLLSASGANAGVLAAVADAEIVDVNALAAPGAYSRSSTRRAPSNL